MELREQVFVSSTYTDLKEERQEVIQTLLEASCFPAGMELFPATDLDRWSLIQREIDDSDYYIVIVGGRYGTVDEDRGLSYTEMEFDYAIEQGKPVMGFVHGDPGNIVKEKLDLDEEARQNLERFVEKVSQRIIRYWTSPKDLGGQVAKSLIKIRQTHPAEGWVRGGNALTPELEQEIGSLRLRVRELESQLRDQRAASSAATTFDLSHGDDEYSIAGRLKYWTADDVEKGRDTEYRATPRSKWMSIPSTWNEIFAEIGPRMLIEASTEQIEEGLQSVTIDHFHDGEDRPANYEKGVSLEPSDDSLREVILQLDSLGLIQESERRHQISDNNQYWQLTPEGRAHLVRLRAVRAADDDLDVSQEPASPRPAPKKSPAKRTATKKGPVKKAAVRKAAKKRS